MVGVEAVGPAVERVAVDLDDQALLAPHEVGNVAAESLVRLRHRQAGLSHELQERLLGPRAGDGHRVLVAAHLRQPRRAAPSAVARQRRLDLGAVDEPPADALADRVAQAVAREDGGDLEQRPRRRADPQALVPAEFALVDRLDAVDVDALAGATFAPHDGHLDLRRRLLDQPPHECGRTVADEAALAAREQRGKFERQRRQYAAPDRVDGVEHRVKPTARHPVRDRVLVEAARRELVSPDERALARRDPCHGLIPRATHSEFLTTRLRPPIEWRDTRLTPDWISIHRAGRGEWGETRGRNAGHGRSVRLQSRRRTE